MCAVSPSSGVQHLYDVAVLATATASCKGADLPAEACERIGEALGRGCLRLQCKSEGKLYTSDEGAACCARCGAHSGARF